MKTVLAVASSGGHWVQLMRLRPALERHNVAYVCVQSSFAAQVKSHRFYVVSDANRWSRWNLLKLIFQVFAIVLRERPDVVVTTGAAPGVVALAIGKVFGARTVWLDSIANIDQLSMSGRKAKRIADLWLTQWEHLETIDGPFYKGSVL